MTRRFPLFLLLIGAGILSACGRAERNLRIATFTNLTGPQAVFGQGIRRGTMLSLAAHRVALGEAGWHLETAAFDARVESDDLPAAVSRIASDPEIVCAIIQTDTAGNLSVAPLFHAAGIPAVLPAETAPLPAPFPDAVLLSPEDSAHGSADAGWLAAQGFGRVFLLAGSDIHARNIAGGFLRRAESAGVNVFPAAVSDPNEPPAWSAAYSVSSPEIVYFSGSADRIAGLLGDLDRLGFHGPIFYAESDPQEELPEPPASFRTRFYFSPATADSESFGSIASFDREYRSAYGEDPPPLAALGFDAATACLLPLITRGRPAPRSQTASDWFSGIRFEGLTLTSDDLSARSCPGDLYVFSGETDAGWTPIPRDSTSGC